MVEISGIEPLTSCVQGRRSPSWAIAPYSYCRDRLHTRSGILHARNAIFSQARRGDAKHSSLCEPSSQRSMRENLVGLSGLEPPTSPLSGVRSNHLSYKPVEVFLLVTFLSDNLCEHFERQYLQVRRWSNRRFPYGYLVTTSPQSWITKW